MQIDETLQVAIALGLLTAEVTAPPFNNLVCTFSSNPELHQIKGDSLVQKVVTDSTLHSLHIQYEGPAAYCGWRSMVLAMYA